MIDFPRHYPGQSVKLATDQEDLDHDGNKRITPAGSWGHITSVAAESDTSTAWNVVFVNSGWIVLDDDELDDKSIISELAPPDTLEEHLLWTIYATKELDLTYEDAIVKDSAVTILNYSAIILITLRDYREQDETLKTIREALK